MDTQINCLTKASDEWYTPIEIINLLGKFDLDPCAPITPLWKTAETMYNKLDNGLTKPWTGRVWLNPPYSKPLLWHFIERLVEHNNGIALLYNRTDSHKFHDVVFKNAKSMLFLYQRVRFYSPDGKIGNSPCAGNILVAFGNDNDEILKACGMKGKYVRLN